MLLGRMGLLGVRLGSRSLLLRCDVDPALAHVKGRVETLLHDRGLDLVEPDARLGDIAAIQVAGIRGAMWDLWGDDRGRAVDDLNRAALGDDADPGAAPGPTSDLAPGMSLDDLLDEWSPGDPRA
ncbi:MAG: hypothetical protein ABR575_01205 [Actinomycetota bacterium]